MKKAAIIVAAGTGSRMGQAQPKQFVPLLGKPVFRHALEAFLLAYPDLELALVIPADGHERVAEAIKDLSVSREIRLVTGGSTRFRSVYAGLGALTGADWIAVHDAARCLVSPGLVRHCFEEALAHGSAVPVVEVPDSVRRISETGSIEIVDRSRLRLVQTPQVFPRPWLQKAFQQEELPSFTDEATVIESAGYSIHLCAGDPGNFKITRPTDLILAEAMLKSRA